MMRGRTRGRSLLNIRAPANAPVEAQRDFNNDFNADFGPGAIGYDVRILPNPTEEA